MDPNPLHSGSIEPLPPELAAEFSAVDARLAREAAHLTPPPGLADRIFEASASLLPAPAALPFVARRTIRPAMVLGRLAMAASVTLAFAVGAWFLRSAPVAVTPEPVRVVERNVMTPLAREAERVLFDGLDSPTLQVAYLLDTRDITLDDLSSELSLLIAELEM